MDIFIFPLTEIVDNPTESLRNFLEHNELTNPKWVSRFHEQNITKPDQILPIMGDKEIYEVLSHGASSQEQVALKKVLKIIDHPENPINDIEVYFEKARLKPSYWSPIFAKQLGVASAEAMQYVGGESYPTLQLFAREINEKTALRKVLNMEKEGIVFHNQREKQRHKLKRRQAESKEILQQLKNLEKKGKNRCDQEVKQMENNFRERLQIPPGSWFSEHTNLCEVINQLEACHTKLDRILETRSEIRGLPVIQSDSGCLPLRGVLLTKGLDDQLQNRDVLLKVPSDIHLMEPFHSQHDIIKQFTNKQQEDEFTKTVDRLGYSVVAFTNAGFWGFTFQASLSCRQVRERNQTSEHHEEEMYSSIVKYSVMPLASCYFSDSQLQLSDDAIKHLQMIEEVVDSKQNLQKKCEDFFQKFGSHANKGPLHFGGTYQCNSYSSGFKLSDTATIQTIQSEAINLPVSIDVSTPLSTSSLQEKLHGKYSDSLISQTSLKVTKTGGSPEASGLPEWKNGLIASNSTWSVIDRGTTLVPVWDIIEMNHIKDFQKPKPLAITLMEAWMTMNRCYLKEPQNEEDEDAAQVMQDMSHSEDYLSHLVEVRQKLERQSMNPQAWLSLYLSQPLIQQFLTSVVDSCSQQSSPVHESLENIKQYMQQLVKPTDLGVVKTFSKKEYICRWLYGTESPVVPVDDQDFLHLQKYFQYALDDMCKSVTKSDAKFMELAVQPDISIKVTTTIAKAVSHLRIHLRKTGQSYEDMFITTMLFPFKYDPDEHIFLTLFSACDLEYLCKTFERQSNGFFPVMKGKCLIKLQAFLFLLAVDLYNDLDVNESQIRAQVLYIEQRIGEEIDPQVKNFLKELRSNDFEWDLFQSQLDCAFGSGHLIQIEDDQPLNDAPTTVNEIKNLPNQDSKTWPDVLKGSEQAEQLFSMLGLTDFYLGKKLTLMNAIEIREDTLENVEDTSQDFGENKTDTHQPTQHINPTLFPYLILQKIMAFDYKCRVKLICSSIDKPSTVAKESGGMHDECSDSDEDDEVMTIHPMDGLLALLLCCDNFLRQDLMSRLATCQLAVPLLLPDPFTHRLIFPLWAMRSIIKEWKVILKSGTTSHERPLVQYQAPLISFLRFGKLEVSKSHMLNVIISDSGHDSFFHFNCDGGSAKRHLIHGLVEVCWYLPSDKVFSDVVSFANLHGDAREFPKQVKFLSKASFMNFVFLNKEDLNDKAILMLEELATAPGGVVVLRTKPAEDKTMCKQLRELQQKLKKEKFTRLKRDKSDADFKSVIRKKINEKLDENWAAPEVHCPTIEQCSDVARVCKIVVDEDDEDCVKGKEIANYLKEIMHKFMSAHPNESIKKRLLLQSSDLWHKWATKDKEQHRQIDRGNQEIHKYGTQKRREMKMIRKKQFEIVQHLPPLMESFLKYFMSCQGNVRNYFLQWLKLMLDSLSREELPRLHSQYKELNSKLTHIRQQENVSESAERDYRNQMDELNEKLIHTSFGLEHLLREVSQIYEAVVSESSEAHEMELGAQIFDLPAVAAELLIEGYPLELMDGDAAHVPMTWVLAVLDRVKDKLSDPKLLVLSILGLQSTGKSTLMNTVFGLRFSVSAGRCTRGAFMQLLPINKRLKQKCKCDYILVVDTEGLRAPELDTLRAQKHDNELATFVIGVANVTVVNIYGEVAGDMDDILQTAVHAFLRMKEVKLTPSCHFVHQNVSAVMAGEKGIMGRIKFKNKLDQMTQAAAKEETLEGQYKTFSQVIEFNDDLDVSHFPSLWKGDPPMAPVNPGYSTKAQIMKSHFIDISKQRATQSLSEYTECLKELWKAILHENFVFSFRNTLEIAAYNTLEAQYGQWSWSLQQDMMKWDQKAQNELNSHKGAELSKVYEKLISVLIPYVENLYKDLLEQMDQFFAKSPEQARLVKWKAETEIRLSTLREQLQIRAKNDCKQLYTSRQALAKADEMKDTYRRTMLDHVKQLVSQLEKDRLAEGLPNDGQLEQIFDEQWQEWIKELMREIPVHTAHVNVKHDVESSLLETLKSYRSKVISELQHKSLSKWGLSWKLTVQPAHFKIHKSSRWQFWKKDPSELECMQVAQQTTDDILDQVKEYLEQKKHQNFNPSFTDELLRILFKAISDFHSENFSFTPQYRMHIALTACGHACKEFEQMVKAFRKKHDPVEYVQEVRKPCFNLFKDQYCQVAQERTAACILCDLLLKSVRKQVTNSLSHIVVRDMRGRSPFLSSKPALKAQILLSIGEELQQGGNFDDCTLYLKDAKRSLRCWLKHYTKQHCHEGKPSRLVQLAQSEISSLIIHIEQTAGEVTLEFSQTPQPQCKLPEQKQFNIIDWLTKFYDKLQGRLEIDVTELRDLGGIQQLKDINNFKKEVSEGLQRLEGTLQDEFMHMQVSSMSQWEQKPYDILLENLAGCAEQCPFCKEQCDLTYENHPKSTLHTVKMHRPECLGGYSWESSGEMVLDICSSLVGTGMRFKDHKTNHKWHPYKDYRDYYPEWSIIHDQSLEASSYWKWLVGHYASEVAQVFEIKEASIPSEWKSMSWKSVKKDLEKAYNVSFSP